MVGWRIALRFRRLLGPIPLAWAHQREHLLSGEPTRRAELEVRIEA
jgi:hypothetical protein